MAEWLDTDYGFRAAVEFDATYIDEAVPVVPIFLSGFDDTWWANVDSAGHDIRITEDDGTTLRDYYLVAIDTVGKTGCIMVNVDGYISASVNVTLYAYCGYASASAASTTATYTGTGYVFVVFPGESVNDATTGGRNMTAVNTPGTAAVAELEFDAATYNGTTQYHWYNGSISSSKDITLESIAYTTDASKLQNVLGMSNGTNTEVAFGIAFAGNIAADPVRFNVRDTTGGSVVSTDTSTGYSTSTWTYIAGQNDSSGPTGRAWINGGSAGTGTGKNGTLTTSVLAIGSWRGSGVYDYLAGRIAWAAISDEVRSANYIATMRYAWFTSAFRTYGPTDTAPTTNDTGWIPFTSVSATGWTNASGGIGSLIDAASHNPDEEETTPTFIARNDGGLADDVSGTVTDLWYRVVAESDTGGSEQIDCTLARMVIGGSQSGTAFDADHEFGARSEKVWKHSDTSFGTLPTPAQLQDGDNFGIALEFTNTGTDPSSTVWIYTVEFRVFYTPAAAGSPSGMFPIL